MRGSSVARAVAARCGLAAALPRAAVVGHVESGVRRGVAAAAVSGLGRGLHTTGGGGAGLVEQQVRQALAHPWEVPEWGPAAVGSRESSMAMAERDEVMDFEMQDFRQSYVVSELPLNLAPRSLMHSRM
ncbi:hypothetical protein T484DRAFT_1754754 [Baffinella frigidus]|nr:hypothetical protein T484DRAFT_1754754 [Cryptophyta sp. CCMP2293]